MSEDDIKITLKTPRFDGNKKNWRVFKKKMLSYLAQKDLIEIVNYKRDILKDSEKCNEADLKDDAKKAKHRMRIMNRCAVAILLSSMH